MIVFFFVFVTFWRAIRRGTRDPEFRALFVVLVFTLALGTTFYHFVEGWDWLDALYFCVITLATIGYGDLTPTTPAAKAFTIFFVFVGIGLLATFFTKLASTIVITEQQEGSWLRRRSHRDATSSPDDPPATD